MFNLFADPLFSPVELNSTAPGFPIAISSLTGACKVADEIADEKETKKINDTIFTNPPLNNK